MNSINLNDKIFRLCLQQIQNEIESNLNIIRKPNYSQNLELKIQVDRVMKILDLCIEKTQIALCLPNLIEHEWHLIVEKCGTKIAEEIAITICPKNENIIQNWDKAIGTNINISKWFNVLHRLSENVVKYLQNVKNLL